MGLYTLFLPGKVNTSWAERFRRGDEAALSYVYRHTLPALLRFGKVYLDDAELLTSLIHESFLKAWEARSAMQDLCHVYRFTKMQVRRKCLRHAGKPGAGRLPCVILADFTLAEAVYDIPAEPDEPPPDPRLKTIQRLLSCLPYLQSRTLALYYDQGLDLAEIARRLGTNRKKVAAELAAGLSFLRKAAAAPAGGPRKTANASLKEHSLL